jgi:hypothetical protein
MAVKSVFIGVADLATDSGWECAFDPPWGNPEHRLATVQNPHAAVGGSPRAARHLEPPCRTTVPNWIDWRDALPSILRRRVEPPWAWILFPLVSSQT